MTTLTTPDGRHSSHNQNPQAGASPRAGLLAVSGPSTLENEAASVLAAALGGIAASFRISVQGRRIVLRGITPSYAEKARAEQCLRAAGFHEVDNCLRVVPSITSIP